ncbi:hypothetical protein NQ318_015144, partial [Aromia moschata]
MSLSDIQTVEILILLDVVIKQERRSRYAKYSILSILTAAFPSLRNVTHIPKSGRKCILNDEQKLDEQI